MKNNTLQKALSVLVLCGILLPVTGCGNGQNERPAKDDILGVVISSSEETQPDALPEETQQLSTEAEPEREYRTVEELQGTFANDLLEQVRARCSSPASEEEQAFCSAFLNSARVLDSYTLYEQQGYPGEEGANAQWIKACSIERTAAYEGAWEEDFIQILELENDSALIVFFEYREGTVYAAAYPVTPCSALDIMEYYGLI